MPPSDDPFYARLPTLSNAELFTYIHHYSDYKVDAVQAALAELRRVLKAGGSFHFVEHGHAPDPKIAHWQERVEPLNKRLAGGCHLTRRISNSIEQAGFEIEHLDTYYFKGEPKIFGSTFEGRARKN